MTLIVILLALSAAHAEAVAARILLGKRELACSPPAVREGERVLVPLSLLEQLGVLCAPAARGDAISLTSPGGRTGEAPLVDSAGEKMLPLDAVLGITGGEAVWDDEHNTATIRAHLQSVEFVDGTLKVNCSFPVECVTRKWQGKLIVDVANAKIASDAKEVYVGGPIVARARLGQYAPDTARVVLDLVEDADIALQSKLPAPQLVFLVGRNLPKSADQASEPPKLATPKASAKQAYTINSVRLETVDDSRFELIIETSGRAVVAPAFGVKPPEIELTLAGAALGEGIGDLELSHPLLKSAALKRVSTGGGGVRIRLALTRIATYDVSVGERAVTLSVYLPEKAGGRLEGMTVVLDPGHGGREKGARWETIYEKDLNLRIANAVKAALEAQGVRVIFSRSRDEVMGLAARAEVAINSGADLFISIHCNSNGSPGSASGVETYYHMDEPSPRALGYAIHAAVCSATGMCDRRARSDRSLYASGLGVLRRLKGTGIPGVLVECGYLNTASDRKKLLDPDYHARLAAGIVAGLKAYVEGARIE